MLRFIKLYQYGALLDIQISICLLISALDMPYNDYFIYYSHLSALQSVDIVKENYLLITRILRVYSSSSFRNGLHSQAVLRRALTWTCGGWRRFTNLKNREYYTASAKIRTLQTLWDFAFKTLPISNLVNMLMKYFF